MDAVCVCVSVWGGEGGECGCVCVFVCVCMQGYKIKLSKSEFQFLQRFQNGSISKNYGIYNNLWIFFPKLDILNIRQSVHWLRLRGTDFFSFLRE